jgi:hypothetical protein
LRGLRTLRDRRSTGSERQPSSGSTPGRAPSYHYMMTRVELRRNRDMAARAVRACARPELSCFQRDEAARPALGVRRALPRADHGRGLRRTRVSVACAFIAIEPRSSVAQTRRKRCTQLVGVNTRQTATCPKTPPLRSICCSVSSRATVSTRPPVPSFSPRRRRRPADGTPARPWSPRRSSPASIASC